MLIHNKAAAQGALSQRLAATERQIGNILEAIKAGIFTTSTKAELDRLEAV